ncbi:MAG: WbqC family protein [Ignavibacteria bacterium]|nr:WbqC family protein [Ignavibacteria bacterium]
MDKLAAIHQPTFFPWLGLFDKISRSDVFVILDNVQYPKKGGSWSNRVKIFIGGKPSWITVPIIRSYSGTKNINEIEIDNSKNWNEKLLKSIELNYKKAQYFCDIFPCISELLRNPDKNLSEFNIKVIYAICKLIGLKTEHFIYASELNTKGSSTDLLISIVNSAGCNAYMCGGGAHKYQEDEKFETAGIKLIYQNFKHPEYRQINSIEFVPGLSIIDTLMNCGTKGTIELILNIM